MVDGVENACFVRPTAKNERIQLLIWKTNYSGEAETKELLAYLIKNDQSN